MSTCHHINWKIIKAILRHWFQILMTKSNFHTVRFGSRMQPWETVLLTPPPPSIKYDVCLEVQNLISTILDSYCYVCINNGHILKSSLFWRYHIQLSFIKLSCKSSVFIKLTSILHFLGSLVDSLKSQFINWTNFTVFLCSN